MTDRERFEEFKGGGNERIKTEWEYWQEALRQGREDRNMSEQDATLDLISYFKGGGRDEHILLELVKGVEEDYLNQAQKNLTVSDYLTAKSVIVRLIEDIMRELQARQQKALHQERERTREAAEALWEIIDKHMNWAELDDADHTTAVLCLKRLTKGQWENEGGDAE